MVKRKSNIFKASNLQENLNAWHGHFMELAKNYRIVEWIMSQPIQITFFMLLFGIGELSMDSAGNLIWSGKGWFGTHVGSHIPSLGLNQDVAF